MADQDNRKGIWLMIAVTLIFAMQDGISRHLAETYNVYMALMVRYWFFALFVITLAARSAGGLKRAVHSKLPKTQILRSVIGEALAIGVIGSVLGLAGLLYVLAIHTRGQGAWGTVQRAVLGVVTLYFMAFVMLAHLPGAGVSLFWALASVLTFVLGHVLATRSFRMLGLIGLVMGILGDIMYTVVDPRIDIEARA